MKICKHSDFISIDRGSVFCNNTATKWYYSEKQKRILVRCDYHSLVLKNYLVKIIPLSFEEAVAISVLVE